MLCSLSCATTSIAQRMDSWVGKTRQELLLAQGPANDTVSDGNNGYIVIYYLSNVGFNGSVTSTRYSFYINEDNKIYTWRVN